MIAKSRSHGRKPGETKVPFWVPSFNPWSNKTMVGTMTFVGMYVGESSQKPGFLT